MLLGNVRGALRVLSQAPSGGIHSLQAQLDVNGEQRSVLDIPKDKHPQLPAEACADAFVDEGATEVPPFHPVLFDKITGEAIRHAALRTEGSSGPSGIDATGWRRMCTAFHAASTSLCNSLAAVARRLCTEYVDPTPLHALIGCRLIPLDKKPGVRPIGVCETARRIIGKTIASVLRHKIRAAAGPLQMCAGQHAGCEAATHALARVFAEADTEAVILEDASNAFNSMNRQLALRNIPVLCPALARYVINTYRCHAPLFVGGGVIYSHEGTTQGDPLAMAMFAIAVRPLIDRTAPTGATQVWFADDAAGGGTLLKIRHWWDALLEPGPSFGYHINREKSWLLVKEESLPEARAMFNGSGLNITTRGVRHLGTPLGDAPYTEAFVTEQVEKWKGELSRLAEIAAVQPHLAFCALTQGLVSRWTYLSRTVSNIEDWMTPLEEALQREVLPSLTGHAPPSPTMRALFSLPARLGELGIRNPSGMSAIHHRTSVQVTEPIVELILNQHHGDDGSQDRLQEALTDQRLAIASAKKLKAEEEKQAHLAIRNQLSPPLLSAVDLAMDDGASSWLSAQPLQEHGFALHKGAFRDAIALRYGWEPTNLPSHCACGEPFDSCHCLTCSKGGFTIARHNEIRDLTASLLREVCTDVEVEPRLQPLSRGGLPTLQRQPGFGSSTGCQGTRLVWRHV